MTQINYSLAQSVLFMVQFQRKTSKQQTVGVPPKTFNLKEINFGSNQRTTGLNRNLLSDHSFEKNR